MTATAYRIYDLPWTPSPEDERRVRRVLGAALGIFIGLGVVIPLLPEREQARVVPPAVPERVVEFLLERPKPPPKPEPKVEVPRSEPEITPRVARQRPVAAPVVDEPPRADPRRKAAASGLLALSDQLAQLRDREVADATPTQALNAGAGDRTRVDRALLTARTGEGSGGIAVTAASSGFGGGSTGLAGHATAQVLNVAAAPAGDVQRSGKSSKAARARKSRIVFDRSASRPSTRSTAGPCAAARAPGQGGGAAHDRRIQQGHRRAHRFDQLDDTSWRGSSRASASPLRGQGCSRR